MLRLMTQPYPENAPDCTELLARVAALHPGLVPPRTKAFSPDENCHPLGRAAGFCWFRKERFFCTCIRPTIDPVISLLT
jgi:hypothetical protein